MRIIVDQNLKRQRHDDQLILQTIDAIEEIIHPD